MPGDAIASGLEVVSGATPAASTSSILTCLASAVNGPDRGIPQRSKGGLRAPTRTRIY